MTRRHTHTLSLAISYSPSTPPKRILSLSLSLSLSIPNLFLLTVYLSHMHAQCRSLSSQSQTLSSLFLYSFHSLSLSSLLFSYGQTNIHAVLPPPSLSLPHFRIHCLTLLPPPPLFSRPLSLSLSPFYHSLPLSHSFSSSLLSITHIHAHIRSHSLLQFLSHFWRSVSPCMGFGHQNRYLENSGCVGMCVNMCKLPTQEFFTNEFGLPLTMNPSKPPPTTQNSFLGVSL